MARPFIPLQLLNYVAMCLVALTSVAKWSCRYNNKVKNRLSRIN